MLTKKTYFVSIEMNKLQRLKFSRFAKIHYAIGLVFKNLLIFALVFEKRGLKPLFFCTMHLAEKISQLVQEFLKDTPVFLVSVKIAQGNKKIQVIIDGDTGLAIEDCTKVSRYLSEVLEEEESLQMAYHLDVTSPGADEPLLLMRQYPKHVGRKLQVKTDDGDTIKGRFKSLESDTLVLEEQNKKKDPIVHTIKFEEIKEARVMLEF